MTLVSYNLLQILNDITVRKSGEIMNVLVTSGGTREDIDPVRGITNYSTGRLGCLIAERFIRGGAKLTYICSETAAMPKPSHNLETITIRTTAQLQEKLEQALKAKRYGCVIHAMAVSDYSPLNPYKEKISSDSPYLVVVLKKNPKLIQRIKEIQPDTILVGFKLLSGASEEQLVQAARKQMEQSRSDYVLANSLENISGDAHNAILLDSGGIIARGSTKEEIAEMIYEVTK
jgi:phosphopantothenate-cysteine ligase